MHLTDDLEVAEVWTGGRGLGELEAAMRVARLIEPPSEGRRSRRYWGGVCDSRPEAAAERENWRLLPFVSEYRRFEKPTIS